MDREHEIDPAAIGVWSESVEFAVDGAHSVAYAEATNDPISQHLDGTYAPPVYAVIPTFNLLAATTMGAVPDDLMLKILHGEQDFQIHRPIVSGDVLTSRAKVVGISGKSSGVVVTTIAETRDATGELVNEQYFSGFFRGGNWPHQAGEPAREHTFGESQRPNTSTAVIQKFDPDQTFRYAAASGDPMPIHTDDDFARSMGMPGIIIHGLCTMAFTSHAVLTTVCPDDPARLKRLAVRFSSPAQPKHVITTSIWDLGETDGLRSYAFETSNDEGKAVIKDGLAVIGPA